MDELSGVAALAAEWGIELPDLVAARHGFGAGDELRLHYLDWGTHGLPNLVFVHGNGQTARTWDLPASAMSSTWRVVTVDLPGHGDSEWSESPDYYTPENMAREIIGLLNGLEVREFVAVCMGGPVGIALGGEYSDRLKGLVLIDGGPEVRAEGVRKLREFMVPGTTFEFESVEDAVQRALAYNPQRKVERLRDSMLHNLRQLDNGRWTWKYDRRPTRRPSHDELQVRNVRAWRNVARTSCPALVVHGELSAIFHATDAVRLAQSFPHGQVVTIPGAGHTVAGDRPAEFLEQLRRFLDS